MADPEYPIPCPKDEWTKVATGVVTGQIWEKSKKPKPKLYFYTYRLTGEAEPTTIDEGVKLFINSVISEEISFLSPVDIYVWPVGNDGVVRADL